MSDDHEGQHFACSWFLQGEWVSDVSMRTSALLSSRDIAMLRPQRTESRQTHRGACKNVAVACSPYYCYIVPQSCSPKLFRLLRSSSFLQDEHAGHGLNLDLHMPLNIEKTETSEGS